MNKSVIKTYTFLSLQSRDKRTYLYTNRQFIHQQSQSEGPYRLRLNSVRDLRVKTYQNTRNDKRSDKHTNTT
jgi:hypothetical protein